ncbi:hypothetical protein J2S70_000881 [Trueperella bonasi]|uniref:Large ribosomal subunit protein bL12 C-terminal domain-containing protein n=1 Tax=Trueperella bonasi TaxID=312286 RepID=A0ABT9NFX7_9ACTO|nr:ribosomal protein L7/L12 [Trueperella bonasi]MDP9806299.1 hypothetical protein [Trueperella bonasi]
MSAFEPKKTSAFQPRKRRLSFGMFLFAIITAAVISSFVLAIAIAVLGHLYPDIVKPLARFICNADDAEIFAMEHFGERPAEHWVCISPTMGTYDALFVDFLPVLGAAWGIGILLLLPYAFGAARRPLAGPDDDVVQLSDSVHYMYKPGETSGPNDRFSLIERIEEGGRVFLVDVGPSKINTIKTIREHIKIGLNEAYQLTNSLPAEVGVGLPTEKKVQLVWELDQIGARLDVR